MSPTDDGTTSVSLADTACSLGEGPVWDPTLGRVVWVDIDRGHLWSAPVIDRTLGEPSIILDCGPTLGAAAVATDGSLLLARAKHLEHRDLSGEPLGAVEVIPSHVPSRLNDGACDPTGRYVVGSLALDGNPGRERFWRLEPDRTLTVIDDDVSLANGIGWSPDGSTMYTVDSFRHRVYARDYDVDGLRIGPRRTFLSTPDDLPDGLTVDAEGHVWVAFWGAGELRRYDPSGRPSGRLVTGVPLTTSCAFAGDDLRLLVVTTAGKSADGVTDVPGAGGLHGAVLDTPGAPVAAWAPVEWQDQSGGRTAPGAESGDR